MILSNKGDYLSNVFLTVSDELTYFNKTKHKYRTDTTFHLHTNKHNLRNFGSRPKNTPVKVKNSPQRGRDHSRRVLMPMLRHPGKPPQKTTRRTSSHTRSRIKYLRLTPATRRSKWTLPCCSLVYPDWVPEFSAAK